MSTDIRVFVHVPKTAGTSFRQAMENHFGAEAMAYDYGHRSPVTSALVRKHVYEQPDFERFVAAVADSPVRIICSHFPADKYGDRFGPDRTLIMLRDPIQRLVSEYQHFVRVHKYDRGFPAFHNTPEYVNRQLAFGGAIPLSDYAFVGLAEHYDASLAMANRLFAWQLEPLAFNLGRPTLAASYELDPELDQDVRRVNADDITFYARARQEFQDRLAAMP